MFVSAYLCVVVRKRLARGVESGVIPAPFKTTCQHGIRPGLLRWRPRSSASAVGLTASAAAAQLPGIPLLFLNRISEDFFFFLTRKETWKQTFWNCLFDAPFVAGSCSSVLWGLTMRRGLRAGSPGSWGAAGFLGGLAKVAA